LSSERSERVETHSRAGKHDAGGFDKLNQRREGQLAGAPPRGNVQQNAPDS
jgi:hypothetical protein